MSLTGWKPPSKRTYEDQLLLEYWQDVGGIVFTEVLVGKGGLRQWPASAKPRRIDAIRIVLSEGEEGISGIFTFNKRRNGHQVEQLTKSAKVEVVEVKRALDRVVLGQVIIGADLLEMEFAPTKVNEVVVCEVSDPVLEMVCNKRGVKVWTPSER